ncbi:BlaI/MecI/CopY family transcriptional regulator [Cumulibacter soli]|uniref:BlaI/MecI/CopY family transcriptional regulator n=1 Tax=Cumulibacter soli TaxID=2546344 RepID=UPI001ABA752D|nr:BlaI/MecI/CopY family transcriptional regulator [Cumulibacter soli]
MMPRPVGHQLGELERAAMDILWDGPADGMLVREVLERLTGRELAYTTVMTVMSRLADKGFLRRQREGRAWRYLPTQSRGQVSARAMRGPLDDLDRDERRVAILHFLDEASPAELDELRTALADVERRAAVEE